jgi:hypothetical protein
MNYLIPIEERAVLEVQENSMSFDKCKHKIKFTPIYDRSLRNGDILVAIRKECVKCGVYQIVDIFTEDKKVLEEIFNILGK